MCFPVLYPNGAFGEHHPQKVKLSSSEFIKSRLYNKDSRFQKDASYRTGALLSACAYISTGMKYALICEMRLIKSTFFNAGILRTAVKYVLNSDMRL